MTPAFIITEQNITIFLDKPYTVPATHPMYKEIKEALTTGKANHNEIKELINLKVCLVSYCKGRIKVYGDRLEMDKQVLHGSLVDRIVKLAKEKQPVEYLFKFLENLYNNPSRSSIDELYLFLEDNKLPITPDGCFLAYKGVGEDYKDCWTGKFDNSVGQTLKMRRCDVDDDRQRCCSYGFHCGRYDYAKEYKPAAGHLMVVKVNPAHVVSVPYDYDNAKCRVSEYTVVGEVQEDKLSEQQVFEATMFV